MKTLIKNSLLLSALMVSIEVTLVVRATAQTFTTLHHFTALSNGTNSDGRGPSAGLILSGSTLYGTAYNGGAAANGTVFKMNADGTGFTVLHHFTAVSDLPPYSNGDGSGPHGGLILSGNTLYGTAYGGGTFGRGTVFKLDTDGAGFTTLHSFTALSGLTNTDGAHPWADLLLSGDILYGTTQYGGSGRNGTMFAVKTNSTGFTTLHSPDFRSEGAIPVAGLILSDNALYGTASTGGSSNRGTIFKVNTDGTGFTALHSFTTTSGPLNTNDDGAYPYAGLVLSGNTLYGTASGGGGSGNGTVFKVNADGTGFTTVHTFTAPSNGTNSDGLGPSAGLILSGNAVYGTAASGGSSGRGTVFAVNTDGTGFTTLHSFTATPAPLYTNSDGAGPSARLILSGNTLYGTTTQGGSSGSGTVFSLSLPPALTILRAGPNVLLTWPTNAAGFTLQFTTNLVSPMVWSLVSPEPLIVNGQNTVTNAVSGTRSFYRLSR